MKNGSTIGCMLGLKGAHLFDFLIDQINEVCK